MVSEAGAFLFDGELQHHFKEKGKRFGTPYVITVDHYSPETRKTTGSGEGTGLWELRGMNG